MILSKIYESVGRCFAISACVGRGKTFFQLFYFCSEVHAVLFEIGRWIPLERV